MCTNSQRLMKVANLSEMMKTMKLFSSSGMKLNFVLFVLLSNENMSPYIRLNWQNAVLMRSCIILETLLSDLTFVLFLFLSRG